MSRLAHYLSLACVHLSNSPVVALLLILAVAPSVTAAEDGHMTIINPERAYGYTIGDVLEQNIHLHDTQTMLNADQLPQITRTGRWLERQRVEIDTDGKKLSVRYQVINSPNSVRVITLPELVLTTDQKVTVVIPAWSFSITPLAPFPLSQDQSIENMATDSMSLQANPLPAMQQDWTPALPSSLPYRQNLLYLSIALFISLLAWATWWFVRGVLESRSLPFARAYGQIRQESTGIGEQTELQWLALHRAFDRMSGRSMGRDSIDALVLSVDWLKPLEADIRQFFRISSERFFANDASRTEFDIEKFAGDLYRAERQHTSKLGSGSPTVST